jgi:hypothetical protein
MKKILIIVSLLLCIGCTERPPIKFEVTFNDGQVDTMLIDKGVQLRRGCLHEQMNRVVACDVKKLKRLE